MLNLAYIKRESSGPVVKAVHPSPCSFLTFSIWELTSSLEDDILGGIPAGSGGSGAHICFLKEGRQPLLPQPSRTTAVQGPAGGGSGLLELTTSWKSHLLPKTVVAPAEACQIP